MGVRGPEAYKFIDDGGPYKMKTAVKQDPGDFYNRGAAEDYLKQMQIAEPDILWVLYESGGIHFVKRRDDLPVGFVPD